MDLVLRRDGVDQLDALQGFKTNPTGFQIGTVLTSFWDIGIVPFVWD